MLKTLTAACALYSLGALASAQAQTVTVRGCHIVGPEACHYLKGSNGHVYHLIPWGPPMPPPNLLITATGTVQPPGLGFCGNKPNLFATKIQVWKYKCK
jgi:hypothetical protein